MNLHSGETGDMPGTASRLEIARTQIVDDLSAAQKHISPKYLYDETGSLLFDAICGLPEYYPTRTEQRIMQAHLPEIAERVGPGAAVIELGAGSNDKARQLLRGLHRPAAYVPVEISGEYLAAQTDELRAEFPDVSIVPVVADFTLPFALPEHPCVPRRNLVFFPGSTIGNFQPGDARKLLETMRVEASPGGALLIGVDLIKDIAIVLPAYNDNQGITAAFNLNVLTHLNSAFDADFDVRNFEHEAVYDQEHDRIEMRLVSVRPHEVKLGDETLSFAAGEHIVTEYSHKYTIASFRKLAQQSGWRWTTCWMDDYRLFSVHFLVAPETAST